MFGTDVMTPVTTALFVIVSVFLLTLLALDMRRTSHEKHLRRHMRSFVTKNAMKSFSVITHIDQDETAVERMAEMLEKQHYSKLQLLVFIDSTVAKSYVTKLRRLQRQKRNVIKITIVRRKADSPDDSYVRRYAKSDALLWLGPNERLSADFFTRMSLELLDESSSGITPRVALSIDDSLSSASKALSQIVAQTFRTLVRNHATDPRVKRRSDFLQNIEGEVVTVEHSTIMSQQASVHIPRVAYWIAAAAVAAVVAITTLSYIYLPQAWKIITATSLATGTLLLALRVMTYPYKISQLLPLLLLTPFWPFMALLVAMSKATRRIVVTGSRRLHPARRQS